MKKLISMVLVMVMLMSCAMAECGCVTADYEKKIVYDMISIDDIVITEEEAEILFELIAFGDIGCGEARKTVLKVLLVNYKLINENFSSVQMNLLMEYVAKCCCEMEHIEPENAVEIPKPAATCSHTGGTHENGGKCSKCGKVYQNHTVGEWESRDSTWHYKFCACGERVSYEYHKFDGNTYGKDNGMVKRYCTVCKAYSWVYARTESCCGCKDCTGCCEDCGCGCNK